MRRTKIVATLGPATSSEERIEAILEAGVDVVRLNFSHGEPEEHEEHLRRVRKAAKGLDKPVAALLDLQGPKVRVGELENGEEVTLRAGKTLVLQAEPMEGNEERVSTTYADLARVARTGQRVLIDDGLLELKVAAVREDAREVECEIVVGGPLKPRKGINLPDTETTLPSVTEKDEADVETGLRIGVDAIALSFVRTANDVKALRKVIGERGEDMPVIAKIEKPEGVRNIREILQECQGIMVARGDLGVEMSPEQVPVIQKQLLAESLHMGKFSITATQMLESMTRNPRPTRAEASDVANAILDRTDAVMLSGETAVGDYPVETVQQMARIITCTEPAYFDQRTARRGSDLPLFELDRPHTRAVCQAAVGTAELVEAQAIMVFTSSGKTARLVASMRPRNRVVAFTYVEPTYRRLSLVWGVTPILMPEVKDKGRLLTEADKRLKAVGVAEDGETVIAIIGTSVAEGAANTMKIHEVGVSV